MVTNFKFLMTAIQKLLALAHAWIRCTEAGHPANWHGKVHRQLPVYGSKIECPFYTDRSNCLRRSTCAHQ